MALQSRRSIDYTASCNRPGHRYQIKLPTDHFIDVLIDASTSRSNSRARSLSRFSRKQATFITTWHPAPTSHACVCETQFSIFVEAVFMCMNWGLTMGADAASAFMHTNAALLMHQILLPFLCGLSSRRRVRTTALKPHHISIRKKIAPAPASCHTR